MTKLELLHGDITGMEVDAIVNAANTSLSGGGGVDRAIHGAGGPTIAEECREIIAGQGPIAAGDAVITTAGSLPARHVIHAVGPIWGQSDETTAVALLGSCYTRSLDLAEVASCRTIAFPNISTGAYRFPKDLAAETAIAAVRSWRGDVTDATFVCFDTENYAIYRALLTVSD